MTSRAFPRRSLLGGALAAATLPLARRAAAQAQPVVFLSTQLRPIEQAQALRQRILRGAPAPVEFVTEQAFALTVRLRAEQEAGRRTVSMVDAVHGELQPLVPMEVLDPIDDVAATLADRGIPPALMQLGKFGTARQLYVPWMQATYIMVAHRRALPHLPQGADIGALTYEQLMQWAANMRQASGQRRLGFPAGPQGLMMRFFQGYLYPSFTGSAVSAFRSAEAERMWTWFKELWAHVHPNSLNYGFMQEPLLAGEVWLAWEHVAKVIDALRERPADFVAFPAPAGPKGRGYMPVVAGLAIARGAPNRAGAAQTIEFLSRPQTQLATAVETGFFPVVRTELPSDLPAGIRIAADAIARTQAARDALASLLPVGLGDKAGEFNNVYVNTFQRIVLRGEPVRATLDREAENLRAIMTATAAPCWAPDPPSAGACPVN